MHAMRHDHSIPDVFEKGCLGKNCYNKVFPRTTFSFFLFFSLSFLLLPFSSHAVSVIPAGTTQAVVVVSEGWEAVPALLRRYERDTGKGAWRQVGDEVPVVLGRSGLGWGRGLHGEGAPYSREGEPGKREGDGRAPAGVFALGKVFGYEAQELDGVKMPLEVMDKGQVCVDDVKSRHYNHIVLGGEQDWDSCEQIHRPDELYRYGVVVEHNMTPTRPGDGSCIFMHVWRGLDIPTAGCTAMEMERIRELVFWLDPARKPVLVQMPSTAFEDLRTPWGLP